MTNSPNRKNAYDKFDAWKALKEKNVDEKINALRAQIKELRRVKQN